MASGVYMGYLPTTPKRNREGRSHWRDDNRVPALRLRVPSRSARASTPSLPAGNTAPILLPIVHGDPQPFTIRETSCRHLEHRSSSRRCLASDTREITLDQQAAYCLGPRHVECARFRDAEGLPKILPQRLAVYTLMIMAMIALIVVAGIQTARHDAEASDGASVGVELVGD